MNRSAAIRALDEARRQREYAVLAKEREPRAVPDHIRRGKEWVAKAAAIRELGGMK